MADSGLIETLAVPHKAREAYRALLREGLSLLPMVRAGLSHPDPSVRAYCCRFLDHYLEPDALGELLAMLDDPDPQVRGHSLHALACDRCKEGACRPDEALVLPAAMRMLAGDPDPHVRAMAVEVVGLSVHTRPEAEAALVDAKRRDPSPMVRKKAGWFAPGGSVYVRTKPKPPRKARPGPQH